jgi:potassium channel subfamily K, other eukaryote
LDAYWSTGKPFFVLWSLIAVPSVTALIGGVGDTMGSVVQDATTWFWKNTILPEPQSVEEQDKESGKQSWRDLCTAGN